MVPARRLRQVLDIRHLAGFRSVGKIGGQLVEFWVAAAVLPFDCAVCAAVCRLVAICCVTCAYCVGLLCCSCCSVLSTCPSGESCPLSDCVPVHFVLLRPPGQPGALQQRVHNRLDIAARDILNRIDAHARSLPAFSGPIPMLLKGRAPRLPHAVKILTPRQNSAALPPFPARCTLQYPHGGRRPRIPARRVLRNVPRGSGEGRQRTRERRTSAGAVARVSFERGMTLSDICRRQLEDAETRVEMLIRKEGKIAAEPFRPEKSENMNLREYLARQQQLVDAELDRLVPPETAPPKPSIAPCGTACSPAENASARSFAWKPRTPPRRKWTESPPAPARSS